MSKRFLTPPNLPSGTPVPAVGTIGDLFYETVEQKIFVHDGTTWVIAQGSGGGGVTVSETAPVEPNEGDGWFNPTTGKQYIWYDSYWIEVQGGGGGRSSVEASETAPTDPIDGALWFNTATGALLTWYDSYWIQLSGAGGGSGGGTTQLYGLKYDVLTGNLYIDELDVTNETPATDVSQYFEWFTTESLFDFSIVSDRLIMEVN